MENSRAAFRQLTYPKVLITALLLGVLAWFSEGLALWLILAALESPLSLNGAVAIYSISTLVGALSTLPGGLVGTEASMLALLRQVGAGRGAASAGTLLVRLVTLWFAVLLGILALVLLSRQRGAYTEAEESGSLGMR